jgi:hypothetical protein
MTDIQVSQATVRGLNEPTPDEQVSQALTRAVYNFPSEGVEVSQATVRTLDEPEPTIQVSQAFVRVIYRGRQADPKARVWAFDQDGHEFYVLGLGEEGTMVYDRATGQWHYWQSGQFRTWRPRVGLNWRGQAWGGDETLGLVWRLDPTAGNDESATTPNEFRPFTRQVTAVMPLRGRARARINGVRLTISNGNPTNPFGLGAMTMRFSDDQGRSWHDAGTIPVQVGNDTQEFLWRSLGVARPPGRVFVFEDESATIRIDGADVDFTGGDGG